MNMKEIIAKKKRGEVLSKEELAFAFNGYFKEEVPNYQMSALLMAICFTGMTLEETYHLTDIFIKSGNTLDLSNIPYPKVDKHSTGGIGDKTTLIIGPIVSSLGVAVPKMSGRGLGITGGTIDKLESIPGFRTALSKEEFLSLLEQNFFAVTSQTEDLVPMDQKIYKLRDVTGTTESLPLIASSILSKKIAGGADQILIDIKVGEGALVKTMEDALKLSDLMKKVASFYNREVRTLITPMDTPLGRAIGNRIEVLEAMEILKGKLNSTLAELCIQIASHMVSMGKKIPYDEAKVQVVESLQNGKAYQQFVIFVQSQGGSLTDLSLSENVQVIKSPKTGKVTKVHAYKIGELALSLGAGRMSLEEEIDPGAGIYLNKVVGEEVNEGDALFTLYGKIPSSLSIEDYYEIN